MIAQGYNVVVDEDVTLNAFAVDIDAVAALQVYDDRGLIVADDDGMLPADPFVDDVDITKRVSPDQKARLVQAELLQRLVLTGQDQLRRRLDDVGRLFFAPSFVRDVFDQ